MAVTQRLSTRAMASTRSLTQSTTASSVVALSFWVSLLASAALFAAIVLAPRSLAWRGQLAEFAANQRKLETLQRDVQELEAMTFALEYDADYARRIALQEFDPKRKTNVASATAVTGSLPPDEALPKVGGERSWLEEAFWKWLDAVAIPGRMRTCCVAAAAVLCLFAFFCLNEEFVRRGPAQWLETARTCWIARYGGMKR